MFLWRAYSVYIHYIRKFTLIGAQKDFKAFPNFFRNSFNKLFYLNKAVSYASHQILSCQLTLSRAPMLLCAPSPWPLKTSVCHEQQCSYDVSVSHQTHRRREFNLQLLICAEDWYGCLTHSTLLHHLCVFTYSYAKQVPCSCLACWYPLAYWESQSRTSRQEIHKCSWSLIAFPNQHIFIY